MNTMRHYRLNNPLTSTSTPFIKPIENSTVSKNRLRYASDSDLLNRNKSIKFSSFFQTDI
jgi:hypothetical protein